MQGPFGMILLTIYEVTGQRNFNQNNLFIRLCLKMRYPKIVV